MAKSAAPVWIWLSGLLFAAVHSGMASQGAKRAIYAYGISAQRYRLLYTLAALLTTGLWLGFVRGLPDAPLFRVQGGFTLPLLALQLAGLVVVLLSLRAFDAKMFLGLAAMPEAGEPFHERGIYRHLRHPMYSGVMLALLASPAQSVNSANLVAVICLYFIIGSRLEERRMLAAHPAYADYRNRVPAFIPRMQRQRRTA